MGEDTKIEWADHTFNPWLGCTRVSPACGQGGKGGCYAEALAARFNLVGWGPTASRKLTSDDNWRKPLAWNRKAAAAGKRAKVFCASMADVMDDHASIDAGWRDRLWELIADTPHLSWLLLTKRPENWGRFLPHWPYDTFDNVRLGVTIEDQQRFDERSPFLKAAADYGWPTFVSYEPALGPVDWRPAFEGKAIGWLISGGESGPRSRPSHPDWFRAARDICAEFDVPYLHKQWGEWAPDDFTPRDNQSGWLSSDGTLIADVLDVPAAKCAKPVRLMFRVGKKAAGRHLDGVEHNGMPA